MSTVAPRPVQVRPWPVRRQVRVSALARILRTTDAKQIGIMYMVTSFVFFGLGGFMALLMRAELARPGMQFLSPEQYNQLFTMHGTIMLLLFATPIVFAFANFVVPIQIGAPDVSFPRLNALAYWLYLFGGAIAVAGFLTPGGAADFGSTGYTPLSDGPHSPGVGGNIDRMPRIRSERPAFDAKFPQLAAGGQSAAGPPEGGAKPLTPESTGGATYLEDRD